MRLVYGGLTIDHWGNAYGSDGADFIVGGAGDDPVYGGGGNDLLVGGGGNDLLDGGEGDDRIVGGPGDDILRGGNGRDTLDYSGLANAVEVSLRYHSARGDGYDRVGGFENVIGSRHDDILRGDPRDNRFTGGAGNDYLDGDDGRDTAVYHDAPHGVTVDLWAGVADGHGHDRLVDVESVVGSGSDDILRGDDGDNWLTGREGDDLLDGRGGGDVASFAYAENGVTVRLEDHPGSGQGHAGGEGSDTLVGVEGAVGSGHADSLAGSAAANWLSGGAGDDTLLGLGGHDQLFGGAGDDRLEGGAGDDLLAGGAGADLFVFGPGSGADEIRGFEPGVDRVQLSGFPLASFDDLRAALETSPDGATLQLGGGSSLGFTGIAASRLNAADFLWA